MHFSAWARAFVASFSRAKVHSLCVPGGRKALFVHLAVCFCRAGLALSSPSWAGSSREGVEGDSDKAVGWDTAGLSVPKQALTLPLLPAHSLAPQ